MTRGATVFVVNPASANGSTGRRWPEMERRAGAAGLRGDALMSEALGEAVELAREPDPRRAPRLGEHTDAWRRELGL